MGSSMHRLTQGVLFGDRRRTAALRGLLSIMLLCSTVAVVGCQEEATFPTNPGYLRASSPRVSELTIFDADTFGVYRSVELPRAIVAASHRLEFDPEGRVWVGSSQAGISALVEKKTGCWCFLLRETWSTSWI